MRNVGKLLNLIILLLMVTAPVLADEILPALDYKAWKEQQILEAQNRVVRLSNRMVLTKQGLNPDNSGDNSTNPPVSKQIPIGVQEKELRAAIDNLQYAQELSLQDYFAVYLPQFRDDEAALNSIATKMSIDDIKELLRMTLKERTSLHDSLINSKGSGFIEQESANPKARAL